MRKRAGPCAGRMEQSGAVPMSVGSYGRLCTEFYDLDKPEAPPDALAFYWQLYGAHPGPVLEVMCGSGRFLIPFAERGADIEGVDASPHMLEACRVALSRRHLGAGLYEQFVEQLDLPRRYRFVFVPGGSFLLIAAGHQARALRRIAAHTEPGGLLAIEMHTPAARSPFGRAVPERRVVRPDGAEIILSVDEAGAHRYDLESDGELLATEVESYGWNPRGRAEFTAMLESAGFADVQTLRPYPGQPASEADALLIYAARRSP